MKKSFYFLFTLTAVCLLSTTAFCQSSLSAKGPEILSQAEVNRIVNDNFKKEFAVDIPVRRVYRYTDKAGTFYCVLMEKIDGKDGQDTLHHRIRALCVQSTEGAFYKQWELNDFVIKHDGDMESSIWFWTKYMEFKDLDNDGYTDPVMIYGSAGINGTEDGRIKILIYYKGQKIAIRHQNGVLDDQRNSQIDQAFYALPAPIQAHIIAIMQKMMKDQNAIFPGYWQEAMKKHLLKLDEKH